MLKKWTPIFVLLVGSMNTLAGEIQIIEHEKCNEISLRSSSNERFWRARSLGGAKLFEFPGLQYKSILRDVSFGIGSSTVDLQFLGLNNVESLLSEVFSADFFSLHNTVYTKRGTTHPIVGRAMMFSVPNSYERSLGFVVEENGNTRYLERILLAALYINDSWKDVNSPVRCKYVSDDFDLDALIWGQECFYVDVNSVATNGKPYCW